MMPRPRHAANGGGDGKHDRRARLKRGGRGELVAAALLLAKGYRILARQHRTPYGEVDIIAVRGQRLAFVEVKRRATLEEAQAAITEEQSRRVSDAAEYWLSRNSAYQDHEMHLDAILVIPWRPPIHLPDALG